MGRFDDRARNGDRGFGDLLVWQLGLKEGDDHAARPAWTNIPIADDPTAALRQANGRPQVSWFGHASAHIRLGGASFLVDPVEGDAFMVPRKTQPVPISRIVPKPSAVLVTHNHYDHMDEKSLLQYPKTTPIVAPLGLGDWFVRRGFTDVSEFDW